MHSLNFASMCWSFSHWSWWQNSHGIQQSGVESIQKWFFPEQLCNNQWICKLLTLTHWNNLGLSFHFALIGLTLHLSLPKWIAMPKICAGMFALSEGTWRLNWKVRLCLQGYFLFILLPKATLFWAPHSGLTTLCLCIPNHAGIWW